MKNTTPIDREAVRQDISKMAFREILLDKSLNIDYELAGDEIQSILERLCSKYGVDIDAFWTEVDFDRYFYREFNMFEYIYAKIKFAFHKSPPKQTEEPFKVDDLIRAMEKCREQTKK